MIQVRIYNENINTANRTAFNKNYREENQIETTFKYIFFILGKFRSCRNIRLLVYLTLRFSIVEITITLLTTNEALLLTKVDILFKFP